MPHPKGRVLLSAGRVARCLKWGGTTAQRAPNQRTKALRRKGPTIVSTGMRPGSAARRRQQAFGKGPGAGGAIDDGPGHDHILRILVAPFDIGDRDAPLKAVVDRIQHIGVGDGLRIAPALEGDLAVVDGARRVGQKHQLQIHPFPRQPRAARPEGKGTAGRKRTAAWRNLPPKAKTPTRTAYRVRRWPSATTWRCHTE